MKVIYIPRDPRNDEIMFLRGHPDCLLNKIDQSVWGETIDEINSLISKSSKLSIFNVFCNFLIIPMIFVNKNSLEDKLCKYLRYKNNMLIRYGIYICHPKASSYTELCILITI